MNELGARLGARYTTWLVGLSWLTACGEPQADGASGAGGGGDTSSVSDTQSTSAGATNAGGAGGTGAAGASSTSGTGAELTAEQMQLLQELRYDAGPPPADPSNRFADDEQARSFGHRLFFDPAFSGQLLDRDNDGASAAVLGVAGEPGRVSCAGCHVPEDGFVDTRSPHQQISLAAQWTNRRTPTLLDVAFMPTYNWDGRRDTLWNQAIGVMESAAEFNSGRLFVARQIFELYRDEYEALFGPMPDFEDTDRFPELDALEAGCDGVTEMAVCRGKPGDAAEYDNMSASAQEEVTTVVVNVAKALAAYVGQLRCGEARFDAWLDGDETALTDSEKRGAGLFVGKAGCVSCHSGPQLSDGQFHNVGLRPAVVAVAFVDVNDRGAAEGVAAALDDPLSSDGPHSDGDRAVLPATVGPELEGAFRTPTLRCIADQPSFMHTGQARSLESVMFFFSRGGDPTGYPGVNELEPLDLTDAEMTDLAAFIVSLDGPGPEAPLLAPPP